PPARLPRLNTAPTLDQASNARGGGSCARSAGPPARLPRLNTPPTSDQASNARGGGSCARSAEPPARLPRLNTAPTPDRASKASEGWWRRRDLNPRPKARPRRTLHACPLLVSHARRVEAAKNRQAPDPVSLTTMRR